MWDCLLETQSPIFRVHQRLESDTSVGYREFLPLSAVHNILGAWMSRPEGGVKQKICMLFFLEKKKVIIELNCGEKKSWPVQASRRYHLRPAYNYQHPKRSVVMERLGSWPRPLQLLYWCHFFFANDYTCTNRLICCIRQQLYGVVAFF